MKNYLIFTGIKNLVSALFRFKKIMLATVFILLILSVLTNLYLFGKYKKERVVVIKPEIELKNSQEDAVDNVGKLMRLPQDEKPQVFTINPNTPRNQPFIENAQNGDVLILFIKNQKAILYNPVKNQITNVGALSFSTVSGQLKNYDQ